MLGISRSVLSVYLVNFILMLWVLVVWG